MSARYVPASYTGCYGFRPTHGAVSAAGVVPFAPSFDTVGWLARKPEVLADVGKTLLAKGGVAKTQLPERMLVLEDALELCNTRAQCTAGATLVHFIILN